MSANIFFLKNHHYGSYKPISPLKVWVECSSTNDKCGWQVHAGKMASGQEIKNQW